MANQLNTGKSKFKPIFLLVWFIIGGLFSILVCLSQSVSFSEILSVSFGTGLGSIVYGLMGFCIDAAVNQRWHFNQIEYPICYWYIYPIVAIFLLFISLLVATFKWAFGMK